MKHSPKTLLNDKFTVGKNLNPDDIIDFRHLLGIYTKLYNNKYDFDSYKKMNGVSIYSLPFDTLGDALSVLNS